MECLGVIKKGNNISIEIAPDFDVMEEISLETLCNEIKDGTINLNTIECVREFCSIKSNSIPVLILSKYSDLKFDNFNKSMQEEIFCNITGNNPIPLASNDKILSEYTIKPISNNNSFNELEGLKVDFSDKVIAEKSLLNIYTIGYELYLIVPNHSFMYFEKDELKKTNFGLSLKKTLLKKSSFRNKLKERRTEIRNYTYDLIRSMGNNYSKENLKCRTNTNAVRRSYNIGFSK